MGSYQDLLDGTYRSHTENAMENEDKPKERAEVAPAFYNPMGVEIGCMKCSRTANVKYKGVYFCTRCWEFLEQPE